MKRQETTSIGRATAVRPILGNTKPGVGMNPKLQHRMFDTVKVKNDQPKQKVVSGMKGQATDFSNGLYHVLFKNKKSGYFTAKIAPDNLVALKRTAVLRHAGKLFTLFISLAIVGVLALLVHTGPKIDLCSNYHVNGVGEYVLITLATLAMILPGLVLISVAAQLRNKVAEALIGLGALVITFVITLGIAALLNITDCGFVAP